MKRRKVLRFFFRLSFILLWTIAGVAVSIPVLADHLGFDAIQKTDGSDYEVVVRDYKSGAPITDARVDVADALDLPDVSRVKTSEWVTGMDGSVVVPSSGKGLKTVTVWKAGYTALTLVGVAPSKISALLKVIPDASRLEILATGKTAGWEKKGSEWDLVMAGIVFKAISAMDLIDFESRSFISPLKDKINVYGEREIPSNIVMPRQEVFLPIGSIRLDKPGYRLPLERGKRVRLVVAQGEARGADVAGSVKKGKVSREAINDVRMTRLGVTGWLSTDSAITQDLQATVDLAPKYRVDVQRPPFSGDVLVVSAVDMTGDRSILLPADVKLAINSESPGKIHSVDLVGPASKLGAEETVVALAVGSNGTRLSGVVVDRPNRSVRTASFMNAPALSDAKSLPSHVEVKALSSGIAALAFERKVSGRGLDLWRVYVMPSAGEVRLSTERLGEVRAQVGQMSLVQLDFDSSFQEKEVHGSRILRGLKKFSRSTADVGGGK